MTLTARLRRRAEYRRHEATFRLLMAFGPEGRHYGLDLGKRSGLRPGRLYPALTRLETRGLITSGWDDGPYPRRRAYWLTEHGIDEFGPRVIP